MAAYVLRLYANALLKVLLCMSNILANNHTQKQMQSKFQNSMNMFMEFQECLDLLTACMFVGKIVQLLVRDCKSGKRSFATIVLEAVADNNLWFWHATFGVAGSCNDYQHS